MGFFQKFVSSQAVMFSFIVFQLVLLQSCTNLEATGVQASLYEKAIKDAAVVSPDKVLPLLPVPTASDISVVAWVSSSQVPCSADVPQCNYTSGNYRIWVTLDGEVRGFCQSWNLTGKTLSNRLEQLLGLPPDSPAQYQKVKFVVMKIARDRLERACFGVDETDTAHPQCTIAIDKNISAELRDYVGQQMAGSYVIHNPGKPGYPFTRLGYTYDWNIKNVSKHYGASEFLVMPNTPISVKAIMSTDDYCKQP